MLGLPVALGRVTCPECGLSIELAAQGLRPQDLETGTQVRVGSEHTTGWSRLSIVCAAALVTLLIAWTLTGWGPLIGAAALALLGPLMSMSGTMVLSPPGSGSGRSY